MANVIASTERTCTRPGTGHKWQCWWCWEPIVKGERYNDTRIIWEGAVETCRGHIECDEAARHSGYDEDEPITEPQPRGATYTEAADQHESEMRAARAGS